MIRILLALTLAFGLTTSALSQPLILLTNDDGYENAGLRTLAEALNDDFIVLIAAPRRNQSGASMMISGLGRTVEWSQFAFEGAAASYWIDASPSIAVHWGISMAELEFGRRPDLVISGLNAGRNDAQSHHYSGTVGAARTGRLYGIPSLAISLERGDTRDPAGAAEWVRAFAGTLLDQELDVFLNINLPLGDLDAQTASLLTYPAERRLEIIDQRAAPLTAGTGLRSGTAELDYRFTGEDDGVDSDQAVLDRGLIAVTPLGLEGFDLEQAERIWESEILD